MLSPEKRKKKAIRMINLRGWTTAQLLAQACHVSHDTARKDLNALIMKGILQTRSAGSDVYYTPADPPDDDPPGKATQRRTNR